MYDLRYDIEETIDPDREVTLFSENTKIDIVVMLSSGLNLQKSWYMQLELLERWGIVSKYTQIRKVFDFHSPRSGQKRFFYLWFQQLKTFVPRPSINWVANKHSFGSQLIWEGECSAIANRVWKSPHKNKLQLKIVLKVRRALWWKKEFPSHIFKISVFSRRLIKSCSEDNLKFTCQSRMIVSHMEIPYWLL